MTQPPQPPAGVVITLADIWAQLVALSTKVDGIIAGHAIVERTVADHETRLRGLERSRWPLQSVTILIALGSAVTAVVALLTR